MQSTGSEETFSELEALLGEHFGRYPLMRAADVYKLLHQSVIGCASTSIDVARAAETITHEAGGETRIEVLGGRLGVGRVYLGSEFRDADAAWALALRVAELQAQRTVGLSERRLRFTRALPEIGRILSTALPDGLYRVSMTYLQEQAREGLAARSHSQEYRQVYQPKYRVVLLRRSDMPAEASMW